MSSNTQLSELASDMETLASQIDILLQSNNLPELSFPDLKAGRRPSSEAAMREALDELVMMLRESSWPKVG